MFSLTILGKYSLFILGIVGKQILCEYIVMTGLLIVNFGDSNNYYHGFGVKLLWTSHFRLWTSLSCRTWAAEEDATKEKLLCTFFPSVASTSASSSALFEKKSLDHNGDAHFLSSISHPTLPNPSFTLPSLYIQCVTIRTCRNGWVMIPPSGYHLWFVFVAYRFHISALGPVKVTEGFSWFFSVSRQMW